MLRRLLPPVLVAVLSTSAASAQDRVIHGTVRDAATGAVVGRARVTAMNGVATLAITRTDEHGEFTLTLPPRAATIEVTKARYATALITSLEGDAPSDVRLRPTAALTGRILDLAGAPMMNKVVRALPIAGDGKVALASPFAAITDDRGAFRLGTLPEGRYVVSFPERSMISEATAIRPGEEIAVADFRVAATPCSQQPPAPPRASDRAFVVRGQVLSSAAIPLACSTVRLTGGGHSFDVLTDALGRFEVPAIPSDSFAIEALRSGFMTSTRTIDAPPARDAAARAGVDLEFRLTPWPVITGTLFDRDGEPLLNAEVQGERLQRVGSRFAIAGGALPARTDDLGHYRLQVFTTGTYAVSATEDGRFGTELNPTPLPIYFPGVPSLTLASAIDVTASGRDGVDFMLVPVASVPLIVNVTGVSGHPVEFAQITLSNAEGSTSRIDRRTPSTVRAGQVTVRGGSAGRIRPAGHQQQRRRIRFGPRLCDGWRPAAATGGDPAERRPPVARARGDGRRHGDSATAADRVDSSQSGQLWSGLREHRFD